MNKASGGDGIPVELFQILKYDAVKVLHSICQQIWKTQQWPQDWKRSVFIAIPKKGNAKECSNYRTIAGQEATVRTGQGQFSYQSQRKAMPKECSNYHTIALISHASKVMLKILQARFQKYVNRNFQIFKLNLEKAEEPEIKLTTSVG